MQEIDAVAASFDRRPNLLMIKYLRLGSGQLLGDIDRNPQWTRQLRLCRREIFFAKVTFCPQLKSSQTGFNLESK